MVVSWRRSVRSFVEGWSRVFSFGFPTEGDLPTCDPTKSNEKSPWPHDYEEIDEEYGSLAQGGSYTILKCRRCERRAYSPMAD